MNAKITIITPTTGSSTLFNLIKSLEKQTVPFMHILLWDDKRDGDFLYPDPYTLKTKHVDSLNADNRYNIVIKGSLVQGEASGSALRSIGLMAANTEFVTFADSDVWYENNHLETLLNTIGDKNWAYCRRKVWASETDYIGVDNFESVGDSSERKVPYEMVDNNCMIFRRRYGTSGAVLYRETTSYNDDRLFYAFLKKHAGIPSKTDLATVNQICPARLENFFRMGCTCQKS